jgi:hypothetical protein
MHETWHDKISEPGVVATGLAAPRLVQPMLRVLSRGTRSLQLPVLIFTIGAIGLAARGAAASKCSGACERNKRVSGAFGRRFDEVC